MTQPADFNSVSPTSLSHLIGQRKVIEQIEVALDAAQQDCRKLDHALMVGPPGLGKSALAQVVAQEMATGFHEVLGQSLNSIAELNCLLLNAKKRDIVFIDECHEMKKQFQTALYLALDKQRIFVKTGSGAPMGIPISDFTLLLATTDEYLLLQPLRERMKLVLRYEFYSEEELAILLLHRVRSLGWIVDEVELVEIAKRSRGTPRLALRLLQSCHRVARSVGDETITAEHLQRACELEEIDNVGLGPNEQKYLQLLVAGPARLNVLSSILGLPTRTISQVIEQFLIRAELVTKDRSGLRELTAKGREHVSNSSQQSA